MVKVLEISTTAAIGGTSAELLANDELSVEDLMYGMMLPSGNDAAQSLAIYFGNFIKLVEEKQKRPKDIDANLKLEDFEDSEEEIVLDSGETPVFNQEILVNLQVTLEQTESKPDVKEEQTPPTNAESDQTEPIQISHKFKKLSAKANECLEEFYKLMN